MREIAFLEHVSRSLPNDGEVIVINTGALIGPEALAMLQALYSRSLGGIRTQLEKVAKKGPATFMSEYYLGYGDKSIGDCGTATVAIEGVSMLAAKAIQDHALYSGQESSTRYIDFATQKLIEPGNTGLSQLLEEFRFFYLESQEDVINHLVRLHPKEGDWKEGEYKKAIKARAFDILRGFLPAGSSTNLAWHANLRQFADHLARLRHHPLFEVRIVADAIQEALRESFPNSFGHKLYGNTEDYLEFWMGKHYLFERNQSFRGVELLRNGISKKELAEKRPLLERRPKKTELPKLLAELGSMSFGFMLDFGSFRDAQRHRSLIQRMPMVTDTHGFSSWYLDYLPEKLRQKAEILLAAQKEKLGRTEITKEEKQYYIPMGYDLPNRLSGDLPSLVYTVELRNSRFVHPTLSRVAGKIADILLGEFSACGLKLHLDADPEKFDPKRGTQDIVERTS